MAMEASTLSFASLWCPENGNHAVNKRQYTMTVEGVGIYMARI